MAIITISRGTYSGGQALAECVSRKLGYRSVSRELLVKASKESAVEEDTLSKALEGKPGILERMSADRIHYLAFIRAALINEIRNDNIVYHGNAGHLLLRDVPHVLRVRVIASLEFRINAVMARNKMDKEEAKHYVKKLDAERVAWTRFLYHVDWRDPSQYDILINLDRIGLDNACRLICDAAALDAFKAPSDWEKILADLIQGSQVRVAIAKDKKVGKSDREVEIEADSGVITIKGEVESLKDVERIEEMVRKMPGVKDVIYTGIMLRRV